MKDRPKKKRHSGLPYSLQHSSDDNINKEVLSEDMLLSSMVTYALVLEWVTFIMG